MTPPRTWHGDVSIDEIRSALATDEGYHAVFRMRSMGGSGCNPTDPGEVMRATRCLFAAVGEQVPAQILALEALGSFVSSKPNDNQVQITVGDLQLQARAWGEAHKRHIADIAKHRHMDDVGVQRATLLACFLAIAPGLRGWWITGQVLSPTAEEAPLNYCIVEPDKVSFVVSRQKQTIDDQPLQFDTQDLRIINDADDNLVNMFIELANKLAVPGELLFKNEKSKPFGSPCDGVEEVIGRAVKKQNNLELETNDKDAGYEPGADSDSAAICAMRRAAVYEDCQMILRAVGEWPTDKKEKQKKIKDGWPTEWPDLFIKIAARLTLRNHKMHMGMAEYKCDKAPEPDSIRRQYFINPSTGKTYGKEEGDEQVMTEIIDHDEPEKVEEVDFALSTAQRKRPLMDDNDTAPNKRRLIAKALDIIDRRLMAKALDIIDRLEDK